MEAVQKKAASNQSMDCCKMIAAACVLFVHVPFPGVPGAIIACLSRFSVPFFFAASGYFCFHTGADKIARRFVHILKLNLVGIAISLTCNCALAAYWGDNFLTHLLESLPDLEAMGDWFFFHRNPFEGHLWYLTAIAFCYGFLYCYVRFFSGAVPNYKPLYLVSFVLFVIRFALADLARAGGLALPYYIFRDGLFLGLPMFTLGLFLREYEQSLREAFQLNDRKLFLLLLLGCGLNLFQWQTIGTGELPIGAVLQVMVLILVVSAHPSVFPSSGPFRSVSFYLRTLSTDVYLIHIYAKNIYVTFCQNSIISLLGRAEPWVMPLLVLGLSVVLSLIARFLIRQLSRITNRR